MIMPTPASPQTTERTDMPHALPRSFSINGVYVPPMRLYIIAWSILLTTLR